MTWREEYKRKLLTAQEAARLVKSGDRVAIGGSTDQPKLLQEAIFARQDEVRGVEIVITPMVTHPCWLMPGYEESFSVTIGGWSGPFGRPLLLENRGNGLIPNSYWGSFIKSAERQARGPHVNMDCFVMKVSPPNEQGVVSLGGYRWMKKEFAQRSRTVIAEVDTNQQWFCGDTTMPISEIDHFVEYTDPMSTLGGVEQATAGMADTATRDKIRRVAEEILPYMRSLLIPMLIQFPEQFMGFADDVIGDPPREAQPIADYIGTLVEDGDTVQLGEGTPAGFVVQMGALNGKHDLGVHTEIACHGIGELIEGGVITGKYKAVHTGTAVFQGLDALTPRETEYCVENPKVEVYGLEHLSDVKLIAAHDNYVSMNNALAVDLTGQICFETLFGGVPVHGPGGQPDFHLGAFYSRGGRPITLLWSTAAGGGASRVVSQFEAGTVVSVGRAHAGYVVTEYGIANLFGKTLRERAGEMIAIAHPDFRAELKREAQRLFDY
ncbi:MAG: acetyl-CoA hydrolase/transferase C-terminal domain-containing protein [Chloroflexota bacterium]|nr:acetyl-CoA hydrolase/transferase C-terminal domain-containing protein [Chloroflexota bacterium]